jgi:hypothetical protein
MDNIDRRRMLGFSLGATAGLGLIAPAWAAKGGVKGRPGSGTTTSGGTTSGSGTTTTSSGGTTTSSGSTGTTTSGSTTSTGSNLQVAINVNGTTYTVAASQGVDIGDFISDIGGFTQRCIRADVPGLPMTVFFRPDRTSARVEVVFELGRCFSGTPANLGTYTVTILDASTQLATVTVPAHYWFSRWRWQSAPRPIVGNIDTLISQGLLPPYNRNTNPPNLTASASYTVMGLAGVTAYMPQTGERPDIGLVTEPQAQYICALDQYALATLRAQAEAGGTMPWHMRDENTGAPINLQTYAQASWYPDGNVGSPHIAGVSTPVTLDTAHMPALAYLPYLLTGDPYHLEDMQFVANWDWGWLPPQYRPSIPQSRSLAWAVRNAMQCARMTPSTVPSWLLPQSYFKAMLDSWRGLLETYYVNSSDPLRSVFRSTESMNSAPDQGPTSPGGCWIAQWQEEFFVAVAGWARTMGFTEWQTVFDWKIGSTIARSTPSSGWVRAWECPYRTILRPTSTSPTVTTWADGWALTQSTCLLTYSDADTWQPADMTYLGYSRGAMVYAAQFGTPGATTSLSWATGQLVTKGWVADYKWRIGSGL